MSRQAQHLMGTKDKPRAGGGAEKSPINLFTSQPQRRLVLEQILKGRFRMEGKAFQMEGITRAKARRLLVCIYSPSLFLPLFPRVPQYIPLRAWLYRDGFARFSNTRFTLSSIDDQCILESHLPIPYGPCPSCPLAGPERAHPFYNVC